jgi:streptothricin hydrolase
MPGSISVEDTPRAAWGETPRRTFEKMTIGSVDEPGTPGWPIDARLEPRVGDPVVAKSTDDGFAGTSLASILDERDIRHVAMSGLLSEMCVAATARSALARGYRVTVVSDAHATYDLDDIPARVVARVAEHSLGDEVRLRAAEHVVFASEP